MKKTLADYEQTKKSEATVTREALIPQYQKYLEELEKLKAECQCLENADETYFVSEPAPNEKGTNLDEVPGTSIKPTPSSPAEKPKEIPLVEHYQKSEDLKNKQNTVKDLEKRTLSVLNNLPKANSLEEKGKRYEEMQWITSQADLIANQMKEMRQQMNASNLKVPYEEAFGEPLEDIQSRLNMINKLNQTIERQLAPNENMADYQNAADKLAKEFRQLMTNRNFSQVQDSLQANSVTLQYLLHSLDRLKESNKNHFAEKMDTTGRAAHYVISYLEQNLPIAIVDEITKNLDATKLDREVRDRIKDAGGRINNGIFAGALLKNTDTYRNLSTEARQAIDNGDIQIHWEYRNGAATYNVEISRLGVLNATSREIAALTTEKAKSYLDSNLNAYITEIEQKVKSGELERSQADEILKQEKGVIKAIEESPEHFNLQLKLQEINLLNEYLYGTFIFPQKPGETPPPSHTFPAIPGGQIETKQGDIVQV